MDYYKDRPFLDDISAGVCLLIVLICAILFGQHTMGAFAGLLALAGWMRAGEVSGKVIKSWVLFSVFIGILMIWYGKSEIWQEALLLLGSAILLYQSLESEGKIVVRTGYLVIAAALALIQIVTCYLQAAGYEVIEQFPARFFINTEEAGLFFTMAILCDTSSRRRFLSCIALGLTGSWSGILCLSVGFLFQTDWFMELLWVLIGLSWFVLPVGLWSFIMIFFLLCVPEGIKWVEGRFQKVRFIPLLLGVFNPWVFAFIKNFKWYTLLVPSGTTQTIIWIGFVIIGVILFLPILKSLLKYSAGWAWITSLLLGVCVFLPAPFLLGAGCGMGGSQGNKVKSRGYFFILLIICLVICYRYN